jgi:lipopolysaccharide transport system permease protein
LVFEARFGGAEAPRHVGTYLIVGMLPWMAFADALSRGMASLIEAASLVQKNPLPPVLFPARAVLASAVTYVPLLLLVSAIYAVNAPGLSAGLIALPALVLALYALVFLSAYALAILAAAMRDILQVVGFFLSLGIFVSPILFPPAMYPEALRWLLWVNPITPFALGFQAVLLDGAWPVASVFLAILAWLLAMALLADRLIRRGREHLVDWL